MLASINKPFNECIEILLQNVQLDPGFKDFTSIVNQRISPLLSLVLV